MAKRRDPLPTRWDRPAHTKAKHDILVKYLQAWYGIFGSSAYVDKVGVLDGFAGPGAYSKGEFGSPVLALEALIEHNHFARWDGTKFIFLFNEQDPERFDSLKQVVDEDLPHRWDPWPKNVKVHAHNENFTDLAEGLLGEIKPGHSLIPLFAFIDPFGYRDSSMDLIRRLLQYDKAELFIYFDFNSVNRFAGKGQAVDARFEELFGCNEFLKAPPRGPERGQFLHDLYEDQLKKVCSFAHVRSFAMVNKTGHIGNYLFFCTRNLDAFDRMKYAMWSLDPTGDYRFEDRLADQQVLFDHLDTHPLQDELAQHFAGQTVDIDVIRTYVIAETPYYSGHLKRDTLAVMQRDGRITSPNQRRRNQYPDGTLVTFPA
ncbi:three-Cys-motif partner protein [Nocardioides sp. YR527]|uniref:three-Cys-motif partner protein TcmP n=1 Tax=Nocardioides sp. YR527 TaxID=1881028 RepID=UPI0008888F02|nr:three-Cys-motif partner protein TcmP [Nocardioides sp. YR527]SDL33849.1 three-Cys-motif partner protein [Nocardioides sp. YR527]